MQLVDELSMIYTTCLMFWATFSHNRPHPIPVVLALCTASLALFITGYYHYLQDPSFHQNAYAILTALVLLRSMYVMELNIRPYFRKRHEDHLKVEDSGSHNIRERNEQQRIDVRDAIIVRRMWLMIAVGLSIFLGGFGIWTLDNMYCSKLRRWRHEIGLPWGVLLEGHGWWHLMTGYGAYLYIVSATRSILLSAGDLFADFTGLGHMVEALPQRPPRRVRACLAELLHFDAASCPTATSWHERREESTVMLAELQRSE